ncbi:MAG: endonuclease domain-containing protein [Xanthobacteraceae bacterium]
MRGANHFKTTRARRLRENSTDAELRLWNRLRSRQLDEFKFVRQEPIGPFVVDFICREKRLIIEVDGGQRATDPRDSRRDKWLNDHRYRVLRFWNSDVLGNIDGVLETIIAALHAESPPHPASSLTLGRRPLPASGER